ncbi:hypothetical protein P692DRAFT_20836433 [Suillus brevipes Sb2]|nr:hypothetical protein P692DRAFT_20836433 [Suillus brevipes Sb2]
MSSNSGQRQTIIIPIHLGSTSEYDRSMFPLMKRSGSRDQTDVVLEATLDELFKIRDMAGDLTESIETIVANAKVEYDRLQSLRKELGNLKKSYHPIKMFSKYRSLRLLAAAAEDLYSQTRSSSEELKRRLKRQLLSVDRQDVTVEPVNYDDIPPDTHISGIAVPLESPLDDSTAGFFYEATNFVVSQVSLLQADGNPFGDDQRVKDCNTWIICPDNLCADVFAICRYSIPYCL